MHLLPKYEREYEYPIVKAALTRYHELHGHIRPKTGDICDGEVRLVTALSRCLPLPSCRSLFITPTRTLVYYPQPCLKTNDVCDGEVRVADCPVYPWFTISPSLKSP